MTAVAAPPALAVEGLVAGYEGTAVTRPIDVALAAGTVLGVLGPNGAGKTTLLLTLAGLLPRIAGEVRVADTALLNGRAGPANQAGVVLVPDDRALFGPLTVRQNLALVLRKGGPSLEDLCDLFPELKPRLGVAASALSGGEQQMLAMARGLAQQPRVLLIDEMSMGLAPVVIERLLPVVRRIADETGAVVLLVEQHVKLALEVVDEALVIVHGDVVLRGPAADLAHDPAALEAAYLGAHPA